MPADTLPPIRMLVLTLTGRCNFACRYCYAAEQDEADMTEETAMAALNLAAEGGARFLLQFSGGEPLLRFPLIRSLVHEVERRKLSAQMQIQTNGSLLTRDIARWLYDHNVGIGLSMDGKPSVNDKYRIAKDGSRASAGVARGFAALQAEGIAAGLTCVVTSENAEKLDTIVDMAYFYGNVAQVGFDVLREQGRGIGMKAPTREVMEKALYRTAERMKQFEKLTGRHVAFTQEQRVHQLVRTGNYEFPQCYAMNGEAAFVDVHGRIYACSSLMGFPKYQLGDVKQGRDPGKVRRVGHFIYHAMDACRHCDVFKECGGGCFSRWLRADGTVTRSDAECAMKQFFIKKVHEEKQKSEFLPIE